MDWPRTGARPLNTTEHCITCFPLPRRTGSTLGNKPNSTHIRRQSRRSRRAAGSAGELERSATATNAARRKPLYGRRDRGTQPHRSRGIPGVGVRSIRQLLSRDGNHVEHGAAPNSDSLRKVDGSGIGAFWSIVKATKSVRASRRRHGWTSFCRTQSAIADQRSHPHR